jgi:hypothetical protein
LAPIKNRVSISALWAPRATQCPAGRSAGIKVVAPAVAKNHKMNPGRLALPEPAPSAGLKIRGSAKVKGTIQRARAEIFKPNETGDPGNLV